MRADAKPKGGYLAPRYAVRSDTPAQEDVLRVKCAVAAAIATTLAGRGLTVRAAAAELHIDAADVQRIRSGEISRFTLDRLVRVASRLGHQVELRILPSTSPGDGA